MGDLILPLHDHEARERRRAANEAVADPYRRRGPAGFHQYSHAPTTAAGYPAITAQASVDHGLELIYQQRATFSLLQPLQVSHYPAVHTTSGGRAPSSGICSTRVGVGDSALLTITADYGTTKSSFSSDPCPDADKVAFEIISQIRAGNP
jgi:hypothetical protein